MKKLSIIDVHNYPSQVQFEFARRAAALHGAGKTWEQVGEELRDARGVPADPKGCEMAAGKWGSMTGYYSAYWEIGMTQAAPFRWHARIIDYPTGKLLQERTGSSDTEDESRRASQQWVLDNIETYRVEAV